ncbi:MULTISPECIES: hypothetical protein [Streptomyces]|uniref:Uncharacterized protein n=1 Tax=Streptomyces flavovirens TaxID=52258 RepID=A0ABV8MWR1_9ACTN|nr:hypothetical protein [Streptomyces sp. MBT51]MBK3593036.1 hypothetical protein [Streptomyces sp. MBT51]
MCVNGYDDGPLVVGEPLLSRGSPTTPPRRPKGVAAPATRLLLALPLLDDLDEPTSAVARLGEALTAVGAPQDTTRGTAKGLLAHLLDTARHDPAWGTPLSGS